MMIGKGLSKNRTREVSKVPVGYLVGKQTDLKLRAVNSVT
jgi:hypothetical protein